MKAQNLLMLAMAALMIAAQAQASVEISTKPTQNMNCAAGVCTPTATKAILNTTDLANMLAAGDVKVTTGNGAVTITVTAPFSWTSSHRLTLDANLNVSFKAPVVVAGQGAVTITTNDDGTGGDLIFFDNGKLDFWDTSSDLVINGTTYALVNDIGKLASSISANPSGFYAMARGFSLHRQNGSPISTTFSGGFDGLGHAISGLNLRISSTNGGLFAASSGSIAHFSITGAKIQGGEQVGFVVGVNTGIIDGVTADGQDKSSETFGGITGLNDHGTIKNSRGEVSLKNRGIQKRAGGVAGTSTGLIDKSAGQISAVVDDVIIGGLIGYADVGSVVTNSSGTVQGFAYSQVGGLAGINSGSISTSYAEGSVESINSSIAIAGGLAGDNGGTITDSYSTATVFANGNGGIDGSAGGLVGRNSGAISTSYATGTVLANVQNVHGGGIAGYNSPSSTISADYWDLETTGAVVGCKTNFGNCSGAHGIHDTQLKSELPPGFDPAIWARKKSVNNGYPYLINNPPPN